MKHQYKMKKHTNLPNEISTTEDTRIDWIIISISISLTVIVAGIAVLLIIGERSGFISKLVGTV